MLRGGSFIRESSKVPLPVKLMIRSWSVPSATRSLQIVGFRGFTTHVFDEDRVQFPGKLNNCTTCHGDSGFELPLAASVRGTSIDTGDDREDPADDILISPTASACSSCHDSSVAAAHMEQNGGSFSTTQAALDGGEVIEQCELCHGPGRSVGVRAVHGL